MENVRGGHRKSYKRPSYVTDVYIEMGLGLIRTFSRGMDIFQFPLESTYNHLFSCLGDAELPSGNLVRFQLCFFGLSSNSYHIARASYLLNESSFP